MTERAERMTGSAPDYYSEGSLFAQVQAAIAAELDQVDADDADLRKQKRIRTATWGLKFWEEVLRIPTIESDSYDIRRSRVLSKRRSAGNLSKSLIQSIAEAYSGGEVDVTIDIPGLTVEIKFVGTLGVPANMDDLIAQLDNVIHAHLGTEYSFRYFLYSELKTSGLTYAQLEATGKTYDELYNGGLT